MTLAWIMAASLFPWNATQSGPAASGQAVDPVETVSLERPLRGIPDAIGLEYTEEDRALPRTLVVLPGRGTSHDTRIEQAVTGISVEGCGTRRLHANSESLAPVQGLLFEVRAGTTAPRWKRCSPDDLKVWLWVRDGPPDVAAGADRLWELRFDRRGNPSLRAAGGWPEAIVMLGRADGAPAPGWRSGRPELVEWRFWRQRDRFPARVAVALETVAGPRGRVTWRPARLQAEGCAGPDLDVGPPAFAPLVGDFVGMNILAYRGANGACDFGAMVTEFYQTVPDATAAEGVPTTRWQLRSDLAGHAQLYGPDPELPSLAMPGH